MKTLTELAKELGVEVSVANIDDLARHAYSSGEKCVSTTTDQMKILELFRERNKPRSIRFMGVDFIENAL